MPNASKYTGGKYLKAALVEPDQVLTIADVVEEELTNHQRGEQEIKLIVYWREEGVRPLALNSTNIGTLIKATGTDETDEWAGLQVALHVVETPKGPGVRLKPPSKCPQTEWTEEAPF